MLPSPVKMEHTLEDAIAGNIGNSNAKHDNLSVEVIIKELNSFWEFEANIESKFDQLEKVFFTCNSL